MRTALQNASKREGEFNEKEREAAEMREKLVQAAAAQANLPGLQAKVTQLESQLSAVSSIIFWQTEWY